MALTYSKQLYFHLTKYGKKSMFPALGNNFLSVAQYSDAVDPSRDKLSKAMRAYLEKSVKQENFLKEQLQEFKEGKKYLENMMGKTDMTQKDVDEAIDYLFPSALYVPKSRPIMKRPEEIFKKEKDVVFDDSGRPFHFLFYTSKPNYYQFLHDAATLLQKLNEKEWKKETPPAALTMTPGKLCSKEELEKMFFEKLYDIQYEKFVEVMTKLLEHKYALAAESFIKQYWKIVHSTVDTEIPEVVVDKDGVKVITVEGLVKKQCRCTVTVRYPGKGDILINKLGVEYFPNVQRREQVSEFATNPRPPQKLIRTGEEPEEEEEEEASRP